MAIDNRITIVKEFTFDAAHVLPNYKGPCGTLHGHTYRLQVGIRGHASIETGMVMDFVMLKALVRDQILAVVDHKYLNEVKDGNFPWEMPTAENMVLWIRRILMSMIPILSEVAFIRLWETPTSYAEWRA